MNVKIFGIPNCGSVKKAKTFFEQNKIDYDFHDYKKLGVSQQNLEKWCKEFGWEKVLNKKGLTWRNLDEIIKIEVKDAASAIKLMKDNTSTIKRPVVESAKGNIIGFNEEEYEQLFI
ncbi:Spx/MgsR family RNA polymerase-binding regulatory protein [Pedobacter sp. SD-b]|uniref:Spx/MgsR family RNA polymerase-binding regulatory protein n=1 Tax=Pedobacter segetis TaxID=2793069 RepID=A0ABS1BJT6_9SPHI|nr:Spx/MgsR family RNA polymerase-binding regulatory protein [Pedobacter segetis]MBK0383137.1 Spx/MgsR family RNA polymerase-binding regulatory protein [Pedobacter segetis]